MTILFTPKTNPEYPAIQSVKEFIIVFFVQAGICLLAVEYSSSGMLYT
jgi:hypothetical protein